MPGPPGDKFLPDSSQSDRACNNLEEKIAKEEEEEDEEEA
jgi:hypothetical protein